MIANSIWPLSFAVRLQTRLRGPQNRAQPHFTLQLYVQPQHSDTPAQQHATEQLQLPAVDSLAVDCLRTDGEEQPRALRWPCCPHRAASLTIPFLLYVAACAPRLSIPMACYNYQQSGSCRFGQTRQTRKEGTLPSLGSPPPRARWSSLTLVSVSVRPVSLLLSFFLQARRAASLTAAAAHPAVLPASAAADTEARDPATAATTDSRDRRSEATPARIVRRMAAIARPTAETDPPTVAIVRPMAIARRTAASAPMAAAVAAAAVSALLCALGAVTQMGPRLRLVVLSLIIVSFCMSSSVTFSLRRSLLPVPARRRVPLRRVVPLLPRRRRSRCWRRSVSGVNPPMPMPRAWLRMQLHTRPPRGRVLIWPAQVHADEALRLAQSRTQTDIAPRITAATCRSATSVSASLRSRSLAMSTAL